jgi:hypothetical protein
MKGEGCEIGEGGASTPIFTDVQYGASGGIIT